MNPPQVVPQIPREQLQLVTCVCGSPDFDAIERAMIAYNRLNPEEAVISPAVGYKCSKCGRVLDLAKRVREISANAPKLKLV